ncbi:hypothetical protein RCH09_000216 [Actimicrobium sp. GrIS 1.19]|uniref:hypothetical protein n=1 Tax=Actimicrobium sp. GrIS 1.19 TaxID=3071708 RepID=UPI002DFCB282|nr:hypothetical protein [Actimicrobium sp. GrIS 1.19]
MASITVGSVIGSTTVTRKVTNVGGAAATYSAAATLPGFTTSVTPASLTLAPKETKSFTVKLVASGAVANVWSYGSLTWNDGAHTVKIPLTARTGNPILAPDLLTGNTVSGSRVLTVKTGFSGRMTANKGGLKDATLSSVYSLAPGAVTQAALKTACVAGVDTVSVKVHNFVVPVGTIVARFALRQEDTGAVTDDNDLMLVAPDGSTVYSGNDGSIESVQVASPAAGNYKVCVAAYGGGAAMTHKLSSWVVTPSDIGGKFNVLLPGTVYAGSTASVGVSWSGLPLGGRFVGGAQFKDASGAVQATTVVRVETNGGLPLAEPTRDLSAAQLSKRN